VWVGGRGRASCSAPVVGIVQSAHCAIVFCILRRVCVCVCVCVYIYTHTHTHTHATTTNGGKVRACCSRGGGTYFNPSTSDGSFAAGHTHTHTCTIHAAAIIVVVWRALWARALCVSLLLVLGLLCGRLSGRLKHYYCSKGSQMHTHTHDTPRHAHTRMCVCVCV